MPNSANLRAIPLQAASIDTWGTKYQLRSQDGIVIDVDVDASYKRVARALAHVEPQDKEKWYESFLWALREGATPAGRIMSNAGAGVHKEKTSTINCCVSKTLSDSIDGIFSAVHEGARTLAAGCGIGYDFSTLRPKGSFVAGVGAVTSGTLSFMNVFDTMCFTIASAGGRRGAQMATLLVSHPAIFDFIKAKRQDGVLRQFNLSVLITDEFMRSVEADEHINLWFPHNKKESLVGVDTVLEKWPYVDDSMIIDEQTGLVVCKVYEVVRARKLWDLIMKSNYDFAEPGFILIDRVNKENNLWFCEDIRTSNPCAEQMLPPYGSCLLGSINLTSFVRKPFTNQAVFDMMTFREVVLVFTRMLDNVVEINGLPLEEQRAEIINKRRHGMGFYGLGSMFAMLQMEYGSDESCVLAEDITIEMAITGWEEGYNLGQEKGIAPIFSERFGEDEQTGAKLLSQSQYMMRLRGVGKATARGKKVVENIAQNGARFTHHTSIAPTGTLSLTYGNNCSNGIEPSFSHRYQRNIIKAGKSTKEAVGVYSYEFLLYCTLNGFDKDDPKVVETLPAYFSTANSITPDAHIKIQAVVQPWIDSAISKTVNVPTDISFEDFQQIYIKGWKAGLKGLSTFRFNPEAFGGVLVTEENLANTSYEFTLDDGSTVQLQGNEQVEYDGQLHTASNLFDAIKEGYFGKL